MTFTIRKLEERIAPVSGSFTAGPVSASGSAGPGGVSGTLTNSTNDITLTGALTTGGGPASGGGSITLPNGDTVSGTLPTP